MHELSINPKSCPHIHKAPLVLENSELAGQFLSRHFEKCSPCNDKIESLKIKRHLLLKQIPFVGAPKEIREIFEQESSEVIVKVKRRIRSMKMKRFDELTIGLRNFSLDIRKSIISREFIFAVSFVISAWSYFTLFN
jgi:hypothetical protein